MPSVSTFTSIINQCLPEPHAGLLSGIVFGTQMNLDNELKQALIATGTLHIIALSGMNITLLTTMVAVPLLRIFPRIVAIPVTIGVIVGFILFVGPSVSLVRAGIMGGIALIGRLFGRMVWALWSWGIAIVVMLVIRPSWIGDLSFQLSVLASLGLILFGGQDTADKKQGIYGIVTSEIRVTLAAQVFIIPLLLFTFGRISLISPFTNALIGWTIPIITVLGFLVVIGGWVWMPLGQMCAFVAWVYLDYCIRVIMWTARIPFASIGGQ